MEPRIVAVLCAAAATLALGGCATEQYVNEQVAAVNGRLDALGSRVDTGLQQTNGRIDAVENSTQAAMRKADSAYKLAEGKLVYTVLSQEDGINFKTNKWQLSNEAQATLSAFAERLKADNRNVFIEIEGHGDPRGSVYNNRVLGEKRALEVRRYLTSQGIPLAHMSTVSWGEERPASPGAAPTDLAANRRVILRVLG